MCLNPQKIADVGVVACRECWQCRETKVDDWVGRCIAESKTSKAAHVVTLTYGEDRQTGDIDHIRAAVLTYSDVQKYLKYLRVDGFPCRYFVVGEYGTLKGRAHWHIILFWKSNVPEHKLRENILEKHWPHGWSYWDKCSPEAIRYACKYLLKDAVDEEQQGWGPMVSKKPPLGHQYFIDLAEEHVRQGISPQNLMYKFPDVRRVPRSLRAKTAKQFREAATPVQFHMHDKTAENFLSHFVQRYREVYNDEPPRSDLVWAFLDKQMRDYYNTLGHPEQWPHRAKGPVPLAPPFGGAIVQFCEKANCYFTATAGPRLYYSTDDEGDAGWHVRIKPKEHDPITTERLWREAGFLPHVPDLIPCSPWD
ncbi:replication initiator protein [Flyfo microvirus Tbat2_110]|nr:replication initiator protein [Flyfo microvirus Tbat2_110]